MAALWENHLVYDTTESAYWDSQLFSPDTTKTAVAASDLRGSVITVQMSRVPPSGIVEDFAEFSIYFAVQALGLAPLTRLDDNDANTVELALLNEFWTPMKPWIHPDWAWAHAVWRHWGADQPLDRYGRSKLSPPWRTVSPGPPGTSPGNRIADQTAATITFRTGSRKHWGRFYMGGLDTQVFGSATGHGMLLATYCDLFAASWANVLRDLADNARIINQWIWSAQYRGAMTVNELSVDNVPDVIRSRRANGPTHRATISA